MPTTLRKKSDSNPNNTIELEGDVGFDITKTDVSKALAELNGEDVHVDIFSYGGDALAGVAIYNALNDYPGKVTTIVNGAAASAASVFAMAGADIVVAEGSILMIHNAWSFVAGDSQELRKAAETLDIVSGEIAAIYSSRTGMAKSEVQSLMDKETWMNGTVAKEMGFATSIGGDVKDIDTERLAKAKAPESIINEIQKRQDDKARQLQARQEDRAKINELRERAKAHFSKFPSGAKCES
jgi:ATP-dependent Clp protease, protease subunit